VSAALSRQRWQVWFPLALVGVGVALVLGVKVLSHPLDAWLGIAFILLALAVYVLALAGCAAAVVLAGRLGNWREAVLVAIAAVVAIVAVTPMDIDRAYPWAYFHLHRGGFALVVELVYEPTDAESLRHTIALPRQLDLVDGTLDVVVEDGTMVLELLMSMASGIGYGYVYAPHARRGDVVDSEENLRAAAPFADGWWWAHTGAG
jgi:hypothetical protein